MQDYSIRNAIIVFYVDDESPWRFSLLTTNFSEDFKKELQKNEINFTLAVSSISNREHIRVELKKEKITKKENLIE